MIAARRSDVADLNDRARQHLKTDGTLSETVWENDTTAFAIGDRVVAHRNNHKLGIYNGTQGTVTGSTPHALHIRPDAGNRIAIPNAYIDRGDLTHAYALTAHKAQGMTCDTAFLLGDDTLYKELGYTALSRGREANRLYTVTSRDQHGKLRHNPTLDVAKALKQSRAKTAAIDSGRGIDR